MKFQIESLLHDMIGKTFMYKNNNHKVLRFKVNDIETRIITDIKDLIFETSEAKEKLKEFLSVDDTLMIRSHSVPDELYEDDHMPMTKFPDLIIHKQSAGLSEIILQNIKLIQEDPETNIKKAMAINEQIKSILDICKIEVEAMKVAAYVHKVNGR